MTIPNREILVNNAFTTLDGDINNSVTSIDVTDGDVFPATGNFRVTVSDEIMICTARSGNTLTVIRGQEGTAAASHTDLENIVANLTQGALDRWAQDNDGLFGYSGRPPVGVISDGADGLLEVADFDWVNQGPATAVDHHGTILLRTSTSAGENPRILKRTAPAPPWTLIAAMESMGIAEGIPNFGIIARQSSSGKFVTFCIATDPNVQNVWSYASYKFAIPGGFDSHVLTREHGRFIPHDNYFWLKLEDDGTDLNFYGSIDGVEWFLLVTHDRDSYMTSGGPDEFGIFGNNQGSSLYDMTVRVVHWSHS